jgi:drug/metabolite transporter (DMT)-like permease
MQPDNKFWFPAKRYGWGWGLPVTWQDWLVLAGFVGLVVAGTFIFPPNATPVFYFVYIAALVLLLFGVCWFKGEPARWRWGNDERT